MKLNPKKKIEIEHCNSAIWLANSIGHDLKDMPYGWVSTYYEAVSPILSAHFGDRLNLIAAKWLRSNYHGWASENTFTHKVGGLGTFASLSVEETRILDLADEAGGNALLALLALVVPRSYGDK